MSYGIGLYEDAAKVTTIITSEGVFHTAVSRTDYYQRGTYRLTNDTLESWTRESGKYEATIKCTGLREGDRDTLKTEYDENRAFFFFPDVVNEPAVYYEVRWVGKYAESYNQKDGRYSLSINVKEV